jgi:hypothetical protein
MGSMHTSTAVPYDDVRELSEAVLRAGLMLSDLLANLLDDLPEDAFPGERCGEVLIEMMTGTIAPAADAAGADAVRDTVALLGAMCDRVLGDLAAALELARRERPPG